MWLMDGLSYGETRTVAPPRQSMAEELVSLPREESEAMLERSGERAARHALSAVGLDGPEAARDISELRSLSMPSTRRRRRRG